MAEIFYKDDRDAAKKRSMLPTDTLAYIQALEKIADLAIEAWRNTPHAHNPLLASIMNDLYDALNAVNWLNED